jgi:hypothetical protein
MAGPIRAAIAVLAAGLLLAAGAAAFDPEVLRVRLIPKETPAGAPPDRLQVTEEYWKPGEAVESERRSDALRVTQDYVSKNLSTWVKGGALEGVERLRHTDLSVAGGDGEAPGAGALNVKLRLAEQVRLTVAAESFRRDLTYDPLRRRMWVDLYHVDLPTTATGVTLTQTYGWKHDEGSRLMLNLRHSFE